MHKIYDANDKAHRFGAPELIYGLWYRRCEKCGIYCALISNIELADKFSVSPVNQDVQGRRSDGGRGKLMSVKPTISVCDNVSRAGFDRKADGSSITPAEAECPVGENSGIDPSSF